MNRDVLWKAREAAYASYLAFLTNHVNGTAQPHVATAVRRQPHITVWREMCRQHTKIPELAKLFVQAPEALTW